MKAIINGKRYDTETAECIFNGGQSHIDVYRKKTGELFIVNMDSSILPESLYEEYIEGTPYFRTAYPETFIDFVRNKLERISNNYSSNYQEEAYTAYCTLFGEPEE